MGKIMHEVINDICKAAEDGRTTRTYHTENGVRCCDQCGRPVEIRRIVMGEERVLPIMCDCERAEEIRKKEAAHVALIQDAKIKCFSGDFPRLASASLAAVDLAHPNEGKIAKNYVCLFSELYRTQTGLLLYGPNGTGKSFLAAAICNSLIEGGHDVKFLTFAQIERDLSAGGSSFSRSVYYTDLNRYALLVLDDLGAERRSEYMQDIVFSIVDSRYSSGKPMIITTNLTMQDLKNPATQQQARIYDRILQVCHPVQMSGESMRRKDTRDRYYKTKELLEG